MYDFPAFKPLTVWVVAVPDFLTCFHSPFTAWYTLYPVAPETLFQVNLIEVYPLPTLIVPVVPGAVWSACLANLGAATPLANALTAKVYFFPAVKPVAVNVVLSVELLSTFQAPLLATYTLYASAPSTASHDNLIEVDLVVAALIDAVTPNSLSSGFSGSSGFSSSLSAAEILTVATFEVAWL